MKLIWRIFWSYEWLLKFVKRDSQAEYVLWIPKLNWKYFFRTALVWDLELIKYFIDNGLKYDIKIGLKAIGEIQSKKVYFNPQYGINIFNEDYENRIYNYVCEVLEERNCKVNPSSNEIVFWENKSVMYKQFISLDIPHPHTVISKVYEEIEKVITGKFNYIYKPSHSKSSIGIREISSINDLSQNFKNNEEIILQKVENINRDCRIIVINGHVILQYWRNKPETDRNEKFVTTATGNGSTVTFNEYSKDIENFALENTALLGLRSAAWDLIEVDDEIKALEVSPVYYPNAFEAYNQDTPYRDYKNSWQYPLRMRKEFRRHIKHRLGS